MLGLFVPFLALTFLYKPENALPALSVATPYLIVFLTSMVLLLQVLRHQAGTKDKKAFEKHQRIQALCFFGFTIAGTVGRLFEFVMKLINFFILKPVLYVVTGLVSSLSQAAESGEKGGLVINNDYTNILQQEKEEANFEGVYWRDVINSILRKEPEVTQEPSKLIKILSVIIVVIIAVVIIFLFILILKGLSKDRKKTLDIQEQREDSVEEYATKERLKKHFAPADIQIRYYYKEFMKKSDTNNAHLQESDTTKDIMGKYIRKHTINNELNEPSSKQKEVCTDLTDIYRKARYSTQIVTKEDAAKMKKLIKSC